MIEGCLSLIIQNFFSASIKPIELIVLVSYMRYRATAYQRGGLPRLYGKELVLRWVPA